MKTYHVNEEGYYGNFGGAYVPEILYKTVEDLRKAYLPILESEAFRKEYHALLKDYVGRPSPLYHARRLSEKYGCKLYLKREDLNHTGAHKINNAIGQILLARKMGKTRIIAETGAGQHGVATATVCALMNMPCRVYMGATDVARQHVNVERMKMLGAEVYPVESGNKTLKDATNEAIRDWCCHPQDTFYIIGFVIFVSVRLYKSLRFSYICRNMSVGGRTLPVPSTTISTTNGSKYTSVRPEATVSAAERPQPRYIAVHWVSSMEAVRWSCRTKTGKSSNPIPSLPVWIIRVSARYMPTWHKSTGPQSWLSTTKKLYGPHTNSPAWRVLFRPWNRHTHSACSHE